MVIQKFILGSPVSSFLFLAILATSLLAFQDPLLKARLILQPWKLVREKNYISLVGSGFIHANFPHLLFNLLAFYYYAFSLEHDFVLNQVFSMRDRQFPDWLPQVIGHAKFVVLYFGSMFLADIPSIIKNKDNPAYASLGASGAISGVVMGMIMLRPMGFSVFGLMAWQFGIVYLGISYIFSRRQLDNVNHEAHLWGGIAGGFFTLLFFPEQAFWIWEQILSNFR